MKQKLDQEKKIPDHQGGQIFDHIQKTLEFYLLGLIFQSTITEKISHLSRKSMSRIFEPEGPKICIFEVRLLPSYIDLHCI